MANLFYGSSNVYRNFDRALTSGLFTGKNFQLVRCTKKAVLDSSLVSLPAASLIVTSVLENFITDACTGVSDNEVQLFAHQQITAHVESLFALVSRLPTMTALICPPIYRSAPAWFGPYMSDFHAFLLAEVSRISSSRLGVCQPFIVVPSMLEADGVHLNVPGADQFLAHVNGQLESMLVEAPAPAPGPSESSTRQSQILNVGNQSSSQLSSIGDLGEAVSNLTRSTSDFESFALRRFKADDLIFARLKEESDTDFNRSREDRVVISGFQPPPSALSSHTEKKIHFTAVINRLVAIACSSSDPVPQLVDIYLNIRKNQGQPLVEARFSSVSGAQLFRREGVKLAQAEHAEFSSLFFSNSVTQSTRVRIEVLKALALKLTTATEISFVQGFISRPLLQFREQEGVRSLATGVGRGYTFVDAVAKFGARLTDQDLSKAYLRAGSTFVGAMSQYFVVLRDDLVTQSVRTGSNLLPLGSSAQRGSRGSRGVRGGRRGYRSSSASRGHPYFRAESATERGTKRAGDPAQGPSKRNENENEVVQEIVNDSINVTENVNDSTLMSE